MISLFFLGLHVDNGKRSSVTFPELPPLLEKAQTYPICPGHSCFAIPRPGSNRTSHCSSCGVARPDTILSPAESISYLPLVPRIAMIVRDHATCKLLYGYSPTRELIDGICTDYFPSGKLGYYLDTSWT